MGASPLGSGLAARARAALPSDARRRVRSVVEWAQVRSIRAALEQDRLADLARRLSEVVPDISHQYSESLVDSEYLVTAVRGLHAFQMSLVDDALRIMDVAAGRELTVVDIGDSAGTHIRYLAELHRELALRCLSVNVDPQAVERVRSLGLEAIEARAEDLAAMSVEADLFLSFETLEHLLNPVQALKDLSYRTSCSAFAVTVPYVHASRVGLFQIRAGRPVAYGPEDTHIFELAPADWRLVFRLAGWRVATERVYLQYPRSGVWRALKPLWRATELFGAHEGFWGAVLVRDHTWSDLYSAW